MVDVAGKIFEAEVFLNDCVYELNVGKCPGTATEGAREGGEAREGGNIVA